MTTHREAAPCLLPLAAPDAERLDALSGRLAGWLRENPSADPAGVAAALAADPGTAAGRYRRALVCRDAEEGAESLRTLDPARVVSGPGPVEGKRPVVFLFPGDGSQHVGMGEGLYRAEPAFRDELERAAEPLRRRLDLDLPALLYPGATDRARAEETLRVPAVGHAALVVFEVALARFRIGRGVAPSAVLGYSLGEFAAAVIAGVFSLEEAIGLVVERARLTEETAEGAMLAVSLPEEEAVGLLADGLSLAAVNGPASCVVSGRSEAVAALAARLEGEGVEHRPVPVAKGYHSELLDPILPRYRDRVQAAGPARPRLPFLSSVTGGPVEAREVSDPDHWVRHSREPIRFGPAVEHLLGGSPVALLEVGPGTVLTRVVREIARRRVGAGSGTPVAPCCRHPLSDEPDAETFHRALGALWVTGAPVDWERVVAGRRAVPLDLGSAPRLALEPRPGAGDAGTGGEVGAVARIWRELLGVERVGPEDSFLALGGDSLLGTRLAARLRSELGARLPLAEILRAGTLARIAARIDELRTAGAAAEELPPLVPVERRGPIAASYGQEALWLVERIAGAGAAYNVPLVLHLRGRLDLSALRRSLTAIMARHEALRTRFEVRRGEPVQRIEPPGALALPMVELPAPTGDETWRRVLRSELDRPFDLARAPMVRALLVRRGPRDHVLAVTFHHVASDGWSLHLFLRELGALYGAHGRGEAPTLPPLPIQYADFAVWQRRTAEGEGAERELAFWRRELADAPVLELPRGTAPDHDRDQDRRHDRHQDREVDRALRGGRIPLRLDGALTSRLATLGAEAGATLFSVLLAGFQALLARYSGQDDVVVGTPVAGRDHPATEGLIGYFVNTLALRCTVEPRLPFRSHLEASADRALAALEHRHLPFERVVEALRPGRETGRNPIYQVVMALQNRTLEPPELPGLTVSLEAEDEPAAAKFDLAVQLRRRGDALAGYVEYAADRYDRAEVARMAGSFLRLLAAAAERPELPVAALPVLEPAEEHQLLLELTGPPLDPDASGEGASGGWVHPVHRRVLAEARRAPGRAAVVGDGVTLTYGELAHRAGALARRLREEGVGPEARVGLCFRRSPALVVAALGTLEAGAAYVPLDPGYPQERLAFMAADAGIRVAVADEALADRLPSAVRWIPLPDRSEPGEPVPVEEAIPGERLAYVVYTSGSTGRPKGVAVHHRGLARLVAWHRAAYGTGPGDRCTLVASPSFDASVWETWSALASGACLHVPPREAVEDPARLVPWLAAAGITQTFLPTPLAAAVLDEPWPPEAPLRLLLTGGDALRRRPRRHHSFRLVNHYGPTESTVVATAGPVAPEETAPGRAPSIGRPIAGGRIFVLDAHGALAPPGVAGELCVGGAAVARGYLDRPRLTAERFVPSPFPAAGGGGERLYRTGDRVRLPRDGRLEFLGRNDRQVKLRGFRVEVGEVEAALARQPGVSEAAVLASPGATGDTVLVGYVVASAAADPPDRHALRDGMRRLLPAYMVPQTFVFLDALPWSANGKIDRDRLPEPAVAEGEADETLDGPVEEALARIWRAVLRVERVGPFSDFFELGGHSLSASRVAAEVRDALAIELGPSTVIANPVLADLAAAVEEILIDRLEAPAETAGAKGADV